MQMKVNGLQTSSVSSLSDPPHYIHPHTAPPGFKPQILLSLNSSQPAMGINRFSKHLHSRAWVCYHLQQATSISDPNTSTSFTMGMKRFLEVRFPVGKVHTGLDASMLALDIPDSWKTISWWHSRRKHSKVTDLGVIRPIVLTFNMKFTSPLHL